MTAPINVTVTSLSESVQVTGASSESVSIANGGGVAVAIGTVAVGDSLVTAGTVQVGKVTTLSPGSNATVVNSGTGIAAVLDFGIPTGAATNITVGNTTTLAAGSNATVTSTASGNNLTLAFGIPAGVNGVNGVNGLTPAFAIGTVSTLAAGSNATVTATTSNGGANVTLNFGIPQGVAGTGGGSSVSLSDGNPAALGVTASPGTSSLASRADHVHAVPVISYANLTNVPSTFAPAAHQHALADVTGLQAALDGKQPAGTYATLVGGTVPSAQLPSYVDDVIDAGASLPATGEAGKIYFLSSGGNANKVYRWSGSAFVEIVASPGSTDAVPEGSTNLYFTTQRAAAAAPVQSVNKLTGALTLAAGSNVTITPSGSTLTIASAGVGPNDAVDGQFYGGFIPSNTISITSHPTNQTAAGGVASFSVFATSSAGGALSYQWERQDISTGEFAAVAGATASTLSLSGLLSVSDNGDKYRVVISAPGALSVVSATATLTVLPNTITINTQPSNQTTSNGSATFVSAATVSPSGTPSYQWQKSDDAGSTWSNVTGATSSSLALTGLTSTSDNGDRYRVVVSADNATSVISNSATLTVNATWKSNATVFYGSQLGSRTGTSVSVSGDGAWIAAGASFYNSAFGVDSGAVYVGKNIGGNYGWSIGPGMIGDQTGDFFGGAVAINYDGSVLIGASSGAYPSGGGTAAPAAAKVFERSGETWSPKGQFIMSSLDFFNPSSVAINDAGNVIAVGAPIGTTSGRVRVYVWSVSDWVQRGSDILPEVSNDQAAYSEDGTGISISSDGNTIAIGAYGNDGNGTSSGHVRIYQWSGSSWVQKGADIDGAAGDQSGMSVSLSSDGNVIAIGAPFSDANGTDSGRVRVYQWSGSSWSQRGASIDGQASPEEFGRSVSLSADGSVLAVGSWRQRTARVYQWSGSSWTQRGADIYQFSLTSFGHSVRISKNGEVLVVGAPLAGESSSVGAVSVFRWS